MELHSVNPGHKFLHSYGILGHRRHGGFKCHCGMGGIKRKEWRDKAVLSRKRETICTNASKIARPSLSTLSLSSSYPQPFKP
ncbi:hypothetical protein RIF29_24552 [Crotalaria pallida]|uniref:Uncharacterized protein n=1 Tax=Crotalaria pallida TaxID=3830 RepID=A0AAN9EK10_CROPI